MQSAVWRIWTRVAVSISYDDNHYTMTVSFTLQDWPIVAGYTKLAPVHLEEAATIFTCKNSRDWSFVDSYTGWQQVHLLRKAAT